MLGSLFNIWLQGWGPGLRAEDLQLYWKETPPQAVFSEICEIFKKRFICTLPVVTSGITLDFRIAVGYGD